jgi:hypothetical protein
MKKADETNQGLLKLRNFCNKLEIDNNYFSEFIEENYFQSMLNKSFEDVVEELSRNKENVVSHYKETYGYDPTKLFTLWEDKEFRVFLRECGVVIGNNLDSYNISQGAFRGFFSLEHFKILDVNSGTNPSVLDEVKVEVNTSWCLIGATNRSLSSNENFRLEIFDDFKNELVTFLNRRFDNFVLKLALRSVDDQGKTIFEYGKDVPDIIHESIVKNYLIDQLQELMSRVVNCFQSISTLGVPPVYFSTQKSDLTFDPSDKGLCLVGYLPVDNSVFDAIINNNKLLFQSNIEKWKDYILEQIKKFLLNSSTKKYTLGDVRSNLIPLSFLSDGEIKDSLTKKMNLRDLSVLKEKSETKEDFHRLMRIVEEYC